MSNRPRVLSKSRFTLAYECPTKLYFTGKRKEYADASTDDEFLKALADGGYQVEALAKCHFPGGTEISTLDAEEAVQLTAECLKQEDCVIYQAAFRHGSLLVRSDIVRKQGDVIFLYEVKAKSWDPKDEEEEPFFDKREMKKGRTKIKKEFGKYLLDISFQTFVARNHYPQFKIIPYLYFVDKTGVAKQDAINQRFVLYRNPDGRRKVVSNLDGTDATLGRELMRPVPVTEAVEKVLAKKDYAVSPDFDGGTLTFEELALSLATSYESDQKISIPIGTQCKGCNFVADKEAGPSGLKNGFAECWAKELKRKPDGTPMFRLWNFRTGKLFEEGKYFLEEVKEEDIEPEGDDEPGLSNSERQWKQVEMTKARAKDPYVDREALATEINRWKFPYHFIDFETTRVPMPFNKNRRAYEQIAFQFSHHVVHKDGRIEHKGEWINQKKGVFPNFEFVRQLKAQLSADEGTIFRYALHENTTLIEIYHQLRAAPLEEVQDREELCQWIQTITESKRKGNEWIGPRSMVDMLELVKRYFYHPLTAGSNSLKAVLPAILATSRYIEETYSTPIYGAPHGIVSRNFKEEPLAWFQRDSKGNVRDPYTLLKPIFTDYDQRTLDLLTPETEIGDGGAAMVAYARMQFTEMSDAEAKRIVAALLRYCELDTFAMVLLYEHWLELLGRLKTKKAA
jgi:hypothetical protein